MFYVRNKDENGNTVSIPFDCEEEYFAKCNSCGAELEFDIDDFFEIVQEHGLYETFWHCKECADKHKQKETHGLHVYKG